jgi:hypothetical protein
LGGLLPHQACRPRERLTMVAIHRGGKNDLR